MHRTALVTFGRRTSKTHDCFEAKSAEKTPALQMTLYIAFIDLTKAFDLVSREGLFTIPPTIGCPPKLQSMIESFHTDMQGTVQFSGKTSEPFFTLLLKHAFGTLTEGMYLRTRSDGSLLNLARLRTKTNVCAVATHSQRELQSLMDQFSQACKDFWGYTACNETWSRET